MWILYLTSAGPAAFTNSKHAPFKPSLHFCFVYIVWPRGTGNHERQSRYELFAHHWFIACQRSINCLEKVTLYKAIIQATIFFVFCFNFPFKLPKQVLDHYFSISQFSLFFSLSLLCLIAGFVFLCLELHSSENIEK